LQTQELEPASAHVAKHSTSKAVNAILMTSVTEAELSFFFMPLSDAASGSTVLVALSVGFTARVCRPSSTVMISGRAQHC
jgi:hypothetical protein